MDAASSRALWREFGRIVRQVHAQRGERFGYPAPCPASSSFGAWFVGVVDDLAADLAEQHVEVAGLERFRELLDDERQRFDSVTAPRLVHGDLWLRNVLVEQGPDGWRITALLDAKRAFFGDPAAEWIFGFLDIPRAFWDGYGRCLAGDDLDRDAAWRRLAYQARGALCMMLEGVRFGFDAGFAHRHFARFLAALEPASAIT
ncbi:MAG: phosphotransferase [Steroidobacteraceae bacterium]|nr:phosphotransferase [Steroidobacteraceae bacterium]MBP7012706.1 phosphotransferase [Steroidobacteraceae bacterium]